jgi:glycine/D-amino acid oxidase-like deaminating enzyme
MVPAGASWGLLGLGVSPESTASDRVPVLGESGEGGLYVAAGWGGDELLFAPAAAVVVADLVTGRTPPLVLSPFDPGRAGD